MMHPNQILEIDSHPANKRFAFAGRRLLLTYKTCVDKENLIDDIINKIGNVPEFIRACHEIGTSTEVPYEHTHVAIDFGGRKQTKDCRLFDFEAEGGLTIHPNWKPVKTALHWDRVVKYIAKEDPDNDDLLKMKDDIPLAEWVWGCQDLQDAIVKCVKKPADLAGVVGLWKMRPKETSFIDMPTFAWQKEVIDFLESPPNNRSIHWMYDPVGNTGKSWLCKWLFENKLAYVVKGSPGSLSDFAEIVSSAIESGWNQRCFIIDIPRVCEDYKFYDKLELLKDGMATCRKWNGRTINFKPPHVIVMANFWPNMSAMSADRWRIRKILPGSSVERFTLDHPMSSPLAKASDAAGAADGKRPLTLVNPQEGLRAFNESPEVPRMGHDKNFDNLYTPELTNDDIESILSGLVDGTGGVD